MKQDAATRSSRIRRASLDRREQRKRDLRQSILRAASDEFQKHGYENFSLRRVAETIGYTPTTIYLYFQNKDDLLLATVRDGFEHFDQTIAQAAGASDDPLKRIEALGRAYIAFGLDNPALYRLMFMQRSDFYFMPRLVGGGTPLGELENAAGEQHRAVAQELLVAAVGAGMKSRQIRRGDPLLVADVLWSGVHGLVALSISPLMQCDHARQVAGELLRVLIDGIKKRP